MIDKVSMQPLKTVASVQPKTASPAEVSEQFGRFLNEAITNLNEQQQAVDDVNQKFVRGEISDVHQVVLTSEKASLGLQLTVQVRNKMIEAYQEIMRMQV
ncbi:flagellar hook-basal body complex protein FliE [Paenibacillus sp. GD4]|uniref:flagellar hook-basal body complex protein FliE n=1 Tax=Paenibacillus TaxID=44249 RepID=UPI00254289C9|nr:MULTISPECIES: flagellar hook-basal body complex protein FliE [Paenibacillus]MDQ1913304.1 flagellar hook-basal body complex protein FliE [Paenibacillus sp. GD4]